MTTTIPGITFDTVTAGSLATGSLVGGSLTKTSRHTCVAVDSAGVVGTPGVQLPSGCDVGDIFEMYADPSAPVIVLGPSGESFGDSNPLNPPQIQIGSSGGRGAVFRKVTSTRWGVV